MINIYNRFVINLKIMSLLSEFLEHTIKIIQILWTYGVRKNLNISSLLKLVNIIRHQINA